ncbi:hypothetical protein [Rhizobium leguminosarum]|uniref:hypothetical protein n=1 Tax=Rhizobium leguminosarum TaxID=384 RepID=UPI0028F4292A|nr:hypothetical protein [Rhizobium leguminosarum]
MACASVDANLIFKTIDGQRRIVELAGRQTRSMPRNAEKRSRALAGEGHSSVSARDSEDDQQFAELPPLTVKEWS